MSEIAHKAGSLLSNLAAVAICFTPALAAAATMESVSGSSSPFAAMHWRNIGPFRGGRAIAVAGVPGEPDVF